MAQDVMEVLAEWPQFVRTERGALVRTSCVMPSGSLLSVSVQPAIDGWIVCDEGSAVWEAESSGRTVEHAIHGLRIRLSGQGLKIDNGKIYSTRVGSSELPYMVAYLATATLDAAKWLIGKSKGQTQSDIMTRLPALLRQRYSALFALEPVSLRGDTDKVYTFKNVLNLPGHRHLILDPVLHQDGSIKSRVIANLDVNRAKHQGVIQRIVYDDQEDWSQPELSLLAVGAPAVAYSQIQHVVDREAA